MSKESEIKSIIRSMAGYANGATLFEAEIKSVDNAICAIEYRGLVYEDVRLVCGFTDATQTILITPKVGSKALCVDLSVGKMRDIVVLMVEQVEQITLNGGEFGGLIKIEELIKHLNTIEKDLNNLKKVFSSSWTPIAQDGGAALKAAAASWAGQQITETQKDDLEDIAIIH